MDAMCYEVFSEEERALRRFLPSELAVGFTWKTIQASNHREPPAEFISTRTQSAIPPQWAGHLKGVLTRSSGFDHLERFLGEAQTDVTCGYLPLYCPCAVAEHALLLCLALSRKLKRQIEQFETFKRDEITGLECFGRRVTVIGVGHIGTEIVRVCRGLGMSVAGVDIVQRLRDLDYVDLEGGVKSADVIFCALPLTDQTQGLLNFALLSKAKKEAVFINVSRGEISPLRDLRRLLDENKIRGVGLDVFEDEPSLAEAMRGNEDTPDAEWVRSLSRRDNVIFTPHNAFNTEQALDRKARQSAEAIAAFLKSGKFPSPVPREAQV